MKKDITIILLIVFSLGIYAQKVETIKDSTRQVQLPYDRIIQPAGKQIYFGDTLLENHAMDAKLSSDGKWLAVEERYSLVIISTLSNEVVYTLKLKDNPEFSRLMNTYSGICWYQNKGHNFILWGAVGNKKISYVIEAEWDGTKAGFFKEFQYKANEPASMALPNELLIRNENGKDFLYVVLNGNNQLIKQDIQTGDTIWVANTGVAPYGICGANQKIYVTNWAGRAPEPGDVNVAGVPWGEARIDTTNAAVREGSVSIFDPNTGKIIKEVVVGLHPNEIISSAGGKFVYITNSNSDKVSVINTFTDEIAETISTRLQEEFNIFFGDSPEGVALSKDGKTLYVANGLDNAIAVVKLAKKVSETEKKIYASYINGFIPTGSYPSSISVLDNKRLYITNIEGEGPNRKFTDKKIKIKAYNTHHMLASVSVVDIPGEKKLKAYTNTVIAVNQLSRLKSAQYPPREGTRAKPLPERIGEPSVFQHVLYIIKENRTYDQVLGDMPNGNGDSALCIYGQNITPNTHQLVNDFELLDNFMVSGKCSAEGHQWTDASIVTDYIEKNMRAWFRSYPHIQTDALVYAPTGFIWDNALKNGKTVRIYGEASTPIFDKSMDWKTIYNDYLNGKDFKFHNITTLNTVTKILSQTYPSFDHRVPDVLKAATFIKELKETEAMKGDQLPNLMVMALPNDHTQGTKPGFPTPGAQVADNDMALGEIVEAISHSKFWKNTVIFVVEDDSQSGWDHVSAYRTVALVISPYSRIRKTISNPYNQPSMVRSIEQILGMHPMNIQDAIASPMFSCFTSIPDTTPWNAVNNNIPLDEMNPPLEALHGKALYYSKMSSDPQYDGFDSGDDDLLNRILWFAANGYKPYPKIYAGKDDND
jgi:YVTN family beta-propeller protein